MTNHFKIFATMADYEAYIAGEHATPLVAYISATGKCILPEGSGGGGNQLLKSIDIDDFTGTRFYPSFNYITEAHIPDGVTSIEGNAFNGCTRLTTVSIPASVNTIGNRAFYECFALTSAAIPAGVTTINRETFADCHAMTSVTIPSSVTSIGYAAFYGCHSLTSVTIPDGVTTIDSRVFYDCRALTSLTIPDGVTTIGDYAFYGCIGLTSMTIPDAVTTIGEKAFYYSTALTSVTVRATTPPTLGANAFDVTHADLVIYVPAASVEAYKAASGWSTYADRIQAISEPAVNIQFADSAVKTICVDNWGSDGEITDVQAAAVTDLGEAFSYNADITSFDELRYFTGLTSIGNEAFMDCGSLTSVTFPDSVTTIGIYAISGCTSLTSIVIPDSVTTIGDAAFGSCFGLTSVAIGSSVTSIDDNAFNSCTALTSVTVKATNPPTLGTEAFSNTHADIVIYVPAASVEAYKSASGWSSYASQIQAIPE